ncbi:MAG: hypothetical protein ACUZ8O_00380 [Candidatus Anammoxibacter sp.]
MDTITINSTTEQSVKFSFKEKISQRIKQNDGHGNNNITATQIDKVSFKFKLHIETETKVQIETQAGVFNVSQSSSFDLSFKFKSKSITTLIQGEAKEQVGDNGFFGVDETANRILNLATGDANDNDETLGIARDAVLKGFSEAEEVSGGALPQISHDTLNKVLAKIDDKIRINQNSILFSNNINGLQIDKFSFKFKLHIETETKAQIETQAGIFNVSQSSSFDLSFKFKSKSITTLTQGEAKEQVGDNGFFGVDETANRILNLATGDANDNDEKLRIARDAVLKGFREAEAIFGGALPQISHDTLNKVLEGIDDKIREQGGSVVEIYA